MKTAPALVRLIESGGHGYPIWCVVRTAILCILVAAESWVLGLQQIWPGVITVALSGVWFAANDARKTNR